MTEAVVAGPRPVPAMAPRVHIIGGSGSGKTTLASRIGEHLDMPVHHLDVTARDPLTRVRAPIEVRRQRVRELLDAPPSVTEGIHLGWTVPLFQAADVIVWLDSVSPPIAARRVVLRFVGDAVTEFRRKRGLRAKFLRFGDYAHHIRELGGALREIWSYHEEVRDDGTPVGDAGNRSATERELGPWMGKVVHVRRSADLAALADVLPLSADGERFAPPEDQELPRPAMRRRGAPGRS
jgi:hypothetical protein